MTTKATLIRGAVVAGLLAVSLLPGTARAGTDLSPQCSDNVARTNGTEIHVLDTPITLNAEGGPSPTYLVVCYSTTPAGSGAPALTGGHVEITPSGVACRKDTNPLVLGVDCSLRDDEPGPGRTLDVTIWLQGSPIRIEAGVELGTPGPLACLFDTTVYTPAGTIGPYDIGVCA